MQKRNLGIDLLRGICILMVILLHLNIHFGYSDTFLKEVLHRKLFVNLFWNGYYGVVIFFTLSGYLITSSMLKKWGDLSKVSLKGFYWLRFSRIIPMLVLLLIILSGLHIFGVSGFCDQRRADFIGLQCFCCLDFSYQSPRNMGRLFACQLGYFVVNFY